MHDRYGCWMSQDWIQLTSSAKDLSGAKRNGGLRGYTMEEVKQHRSEHDAWAVFFGKVGEAAHNIDILYGRLGEAWLLIGGVQSLLNGGNGCYDPCRCIISPPICTTIPGVWTF